MINKKQFSVSRLLKKTLKVLSVLIVVLLIAVVAFYFWAGSGTLPDEKMSEKLTFSPPSPLTGQSSAKSSVESSASASMPQDVEFSVMTYNIGYLSGMMNNRTFRAAKVFYEENMAVCLHVLADAKPDIIAFQEIDFYSNRSYYYDQLKIIAEKTGYVHGARAINWDKRYVPFPYWPPKIHFGRMLSGQAVLSRFPVKTTERIVLEKPGSNPFYYNHFYLDRVVQVVKLDVSGRELIVMNVHLEAFDMETREKQAKRVLEIYRQYKDQYPVLLLGDFNCTPPWAGMQKNFKDEPGTDFSTDKTISILLGEKSLKAAFSKERYIQNEAGALTFPSDSPSRKLDYIFYNHEKIRMVDVVVRRLVSSDHLPIIMRFAFKPGNGQK